MSEFIVLLLIIFTFVVAKYSNQKETNNRMLITALEEDIYSAKKEFKKMLADSNEAEINWANSGSANQRRVIEGMEDELLRLKKVRRRYGIFFY
jgi:hypothetical protein